MEYRQPVGGYDPELSSQVFSGALIHYQDSETTSTGDCTDLLDFTPETSSWSDPALAAGQSWQDPYTNLSIEVQSATPESLTVSVQYGGVSCIPAQPEVTLSPTSQTISDGETATYTVSVTNHDSAECLAGSFDLTSPEPAGWVSSISPATLTLDPGQTGTATLTTSALAGTPAGDYTVEAHAGHDAFTGVGAASVTLVNCISADPTVTVNPANPSIQPGQTVSYTVTIENNDGPACPERSFDLTSTKPSGWLNNFSPGTAVLAPGETTSVVMTKTAPSSATAGTYPVDAKADGGAVAGEGTAACTVMEIAELSVDLSAPASSYQLRDTVALTATVLRGGAPVEGANVEFELVKSDGSVEGGQGVTDAAGQAVWGYKLHPKDPTGQYTASATAVEAGETAASAPFLFAVDAGGSGGGGGNGGGPKK